MRRKQCSFVWGKVRVFAGFALFKSSTIVITNACIIEHICSFSFSAQRVHRSAGLLYLWASTVNIYQIFCYFDLIWYHSSDRTLWWREFDVRRWVSSLLTQPENVLEAACSHNSQHVNVKLKGMSIFVSREHKVKALLDFNPGAGCKFVLWMD